VLGAMGYCNREPHRVAALARSARHRAASAAGACRGGGWPKAGLGIALWHDDSDYKRTSTATALPGLLRGAGNVRRWFRFVTGLDIMSASSCYRSQSSDRRLLPHSPVFCALLLALPRLPRGHRAVWAMHPPETATRCSGPPGGRDAGASADV